MSRPLSVPSYPLHRQSGQAVVRLTDGLGRRRDVLLGKHGTAESRAEYARVIAEWEANGRRQPQRNCAAADLTVNELILAYWRFAEGSYVKNGKPTSQQERVRRSLKPLKQLYGHTAAKDFGPLALKAVREWMVDAGWTRGHVNSCVGFKRAFKWAVENEMVPPSVYHGLQAVAGLKKGRSAAVETRPVRAASNDLVTPVLPHLTPPVRAMVEVQRLAGMRPCEAVLMRPCDIDRGRGKTWLPLLAEDFDRLKGYPVGKHVPVYYKPGNPQVSLLQPGLTWQHVLEGTPAAALASAIVLGPVIYGLWQVVRCRRSRSNGSD